MEYKEICTEPCIKLITSMPHYWQSNGLTEGYVKTFKQIVYNVMKTGQDLHRGPSWWADAYKVPCSYLQTVSQELISYFPISPSKPNHRSMQGSFTRMTKPSFVTRPQVPFVPSCAAPRPYKQTLVFCQDCQDKASLVPNLDEMNTSLRHIHLTSHN